MVPFYGWGSPNSRLLSHYEEELYFLPLSSQRFLVLIWLTSEGRKAESTLEPTQEVSKTGTLNWESSALTTRPILHNTLLIVLDSTLDICVCLYCEAWAYCIVKCDLGARLSKSSKSPGFGAMTQSCSLEIYT